jgi:hypothetical protein
MHLVTGKAGSVHITAENHRRLNAGTFGSGRYILNIGNECEASVESANTITIADGVMMMDGAQIEIEPGTVETVEINSASAGKWRKDVIAVEYAKSQAGYETATIVVIEGTEAASMAEAVRPNAAVGSILDGDTLVRMPMNEVVVDESGIRVCAGLITVKGSATERLDVMEPDVAASKAVTDLAHGKYVITDKPFRQSVEVPTVAPQTQGARITVSVTLPAGSDGFFAFPLSQTWIGMSVFNFDRTARTVSFTPLNYSSRSVSGTCTFLVVPIKEV